MTPPVLLVAFNRPDRLSAVIDALRPAAPERVYVAVDGPRVTVPADEEKVAQTRSVVEQIDWTCEVRTLFRSENVGCGRGVSGAIDWLFSQEEQGVILEDDVVPGPSLLPYCDELLGRYATDSRVFAVSGCNFAPDEVLDRSMSYRFSRVPHVWGWATWRRSWLDYRFDMSNWRRDLPVRSLWEASNRSPAAFALWSAMFEIMRRGGVDTWDYQLVYAAFRTRGLIATSNRNLVENVGFDETSTHTVERPTFLRPVEKLDLPYLGPSVVAPNRAADGWVMRNVMGASVPGLAGQAWRSGRQRIARAGRRT